MPRGLKINMFVVYIPRFVLYFVKSCTPIWEIEQECNHVPYMGNRARVNQGKSDHVLRIPMD